MSRRNAVVALAAAAVWACLGAPPARGDVEPARATEQASPDRERAATPRALASPISASDRVLERDLTSVLRIGTEDAAREGEAAAAKAMLSRAGARPLLGPEKQRLWSAFEAVHASAAELRSVAGRNLRIAESEEMERAGRTLDRARHQVVGYAAYVKQLRIALSFVDATLAHAAGETLLDEGAPERLLPRGAYADLKWNSVHVLDVVRVLSGYRSTERAWKRTQATLAADAGLSELVAGLRRDYEAVAALLSGRGGRLFAQSGVDIVGDGLKEGFFPMQAHAAEVTGDTRFARRAFLISPDQVEQASAAARTGDIVLERRNWFLSNLGIPGFWPHAALWVGSPEEMESYLGRSLVARLRDRHPSAWAAYAAADPQGHPRRILEALSEGVIFSTAEHTLSCDYAACLRPRLPKEAVARAVERAFAYHGRPYDFDFDFHTDREMVCSEVVWKAYEPDAGAAGMRVEMERVMGHDLVTPNAYAALFDREHGSESRQLEFVWFLDGREAAGTAVWADEEALRRSHTRLRLDFGRGD